MFSKDWNMRRSLIIISSYGNISDWHKSITFVHCWWAWFEKAKEYIKDCSNKAERQDYSTQGSKYNKKRQQMYSHTLPIRVCAAQQGRDFEAPDLEQGIHFRGV